MSAVPTPPPFDQAGNRPFSFFPPIVGIEHNDWRFRQATWSEALVVNTKTNDELWVPRRYVGELSKVDEPVMIVGLTKELEYKAGVLIPHVRRVIQMPRAVNDYPRPSGVVEEPRPAPVVGIKLEAGAESRIGRLIVATLILGITGTAILVGVYRNLSSGRMVQYKPVMQSELGLTAADDYFAVTRKLGTPTEDRWKSDTGEVQYRLLRFPARGLRVILMGRERKEARYIGALNNEWKVVDSVTLPGNVQTHAILGALSRF